ncbi:MAG: hypothetical protein H0V18_19805 [Pyrinomonadaceae bacterium]|nr:hypothetical protein [Pyrinomonadaceae bacterium]
MERRLIKTQFGIDVIVTADWVTQPAPEARQKVARGKRLCAPPLDHGY